MHHVAWFEARSPWRRPATWLAAILWLTGMPLLAGCGQPAPAENRSAHAQDASSALRPAPASIAKRSATVVDTLHPSLEGAPAALPDAESSAFLPGEGLKRVVSAAEPYVSRGLLLVETKGAKPACLSRDGRFLLVGARLYDVQAGHELPRLGSERVSFASMSHDSRWLIADNQLIDMQNDTQQFWDDVQFAVLSPTSSLAAVVSKDGETVRLVDVSTGITKRTLRLGFKAPASFACFTPDGGRLLTGKYGDQPRMWDVAKGEEIALPDDRMRIYYPPCFSPDGKWMTCETLDKFVRIYDATTWKEAAKIDLPSAAYHVSFAADSSQLWVQCRTDLCVVDMASRELAARTKIGDDVVTARFSRNGTRAFVIRNESVELFGRGENVPPVSARHFSSTPALRRTRSKGLALTFAPDGQTLVQVAIDDKTILLDSESGEPRASLAVLDSSYGTVVLGDVGASGSVFYRVHQRGAELFSLPDGKRLGEMPLADFEVALASLSSGGRYLVLAGAEGPMLLVDALTGKHLGRLATSGEIVSMAVAPEEDELSLVVKSAADASLLKQYSLPDLREKSSRSTPPQTGAVQYSPDGRLVAIAEHDNLVVCERSTGRRMVIVRDVDPRAITFTHDSRYLLAQPARGSYDDKVIRLYDTATGQPAHDFVKGEDAPFEGAAEMQLSPSGKQLVATSGYGDVIWWNIPEEFIAAKQRANAAPIQQFPSGAGIIAEAKTLEPARHWRFAETSHDTILFGPSEQTFYSFPHSRKEQRFVRQWDGKTGRHTDKPISTPFNNPRLSSADGQVWVSLVNHSSASQVAFWDEQGSRIVGGEVPGDMRLACLASDGRFAVVAPSGGGLLQVAPVKGRLHTRPLDADWKQVSAIALTHDDARLAVANDDAIWLIDVKDPTRRKKLTPRPLQTTLNKLAFTADGGRLVGVSDRNAYVWSTDSGEQVAHVRPYGCRHALAVSPTGKQFATFCQDRERSFVAVWDLETGKLLARLTGVQYEPKVLHFSNGGKNVQAAEGENYLLWDLASAAERG